MTFLFGVPKMLPFSASDIWPALKDVATIVAAVASGSMWLRQRRRDQVERDAAWRLKIVGKEMFEGVFWCEITRDPNAPPMHVTGLRVLQPKGAQICAQHTGADEVGNCWTGPDNAWAECLPMRRDTKPGGALGFYLSLRSLSSSARNCNARALISLASEDISSMRRVHISKLRSEVIQTTAKAPASKAESQSIVSSK